MTYEIEITSNTLVDTPRLDKLVEFYELTKQIKGEIAEVGVYKGGTAYLLTRLAHDHKYVFLFDTFEGMPESKPGVDNHVKGDFNDTAEISVKSLLSRFNNFRMYKGTFPQDTSRYVQKVAFSLVHLDCDIYDSVKQSLEFFYKRVLPGGVIIFDDYNEPNCPGAKLAVDEFMKTVPETLVKTVQSQAMFVKL